jgi:hypothetical protein
MPLTADEIDRFTRQERDIFDMLQTRERVSNSELKEVSLCYTKRLSGLRRKLAAAGQTIACVDHDQATGLAFYQLQSTAGDVVNVKVRVKVAGADPIFVVVPVANFTSQKQLMRKAIAQAVKVNIVDVLADADILQEKGNDACSV